MAHCSDTLARGTFVQVVVQAVTVVAPPEPFALEPLIFANEGDLKDLCGFDDEDPAGTAKALREAYASTSPPASAVPLAQALMALLTKDLMERVLLAPLHIRVADELFVLIRDLAAIPCVCTAMLRSGAISRLAFFAIPDLSHPDTKSAFSLHSIATRLPTRNDFYPLLQNVFEAMAALLGVPQLRKVPLLQERTYWESELVAEAKEAFTTIFQEMSVNGGMDATSMSEYMERVNGAGSKVTPLQVRQILERYHTNSDNRLSLEGFLQYHTEQAWNNHKSVWKDLHAFGYRNDLSRSSAYVGNQANQGTTHVMSNLSTGAGGIQHAGLAAVGEGTRASAEGGSAVRGQGTSTINNEHLTNTEPGFSLPPLPTVST